MPVYRLGSSEHIHAPGIVAWAINGYAFERDRPILRRVIIKGWAGVPEDAVHQLLSGLINHEINGDTIVFAVDENPADKIAGQAS